MIATRLFVALARFSSSLPHFKGKTRAVLAVYRAAGLERRHLTVRARLRRPVRFDARLDLHSWLQRVAFITGGYEQDTVEFLVDLHRRAGGHGTLLDVGANIGLISIPFVKITGARAIAVEPVPDNVAVLRENIEMNGLADAIAVMPFGVADVARVVQIQVEGDLHAGEGTGTANILADGTPYECVRQEIPVRRLDEMLHAGELPSRVALVKIDTDGYDLKVLEGGTRFLARDRPVIFGEFSAHCLRWHGQTIADVVAYAEANGYVVWTRRIPEWRFTPWSPTREFEQDALLVPRERQDAFHALLAP